MKVAVISGGRSSEHEVSVKSGRAVLSGLEAAGHDPVEIRIEKSGDWLQAGRPVLIRPGEGLLVGSEALPVGAAFPVLHGPFGEDGVTQGALDTAGIPYVGSDVLGSSVCMDKLTLKKICGFHDIPQVDFVQAFTPGWEEQALALEFPLWVKPSRLGSSVGITRVTGHGTDSGNVPEAGNGQGSGSQVDTGAGVHSGDGAGFDRESALAELRAAVTVAATHDPRVIIEANSSGREVECSVLGNEKPETSLPGEIIADAEWYDFEAKYTEGRMHLSVPAAIGDQQVTALRELAVRVFTLAGCSGLARCDFFVDEDGSILLNEINTIPGFTETSVYSKLWEASGLPYPELCDRLVNLAVERHRHESQHRF